MQICIHTYSCKRNTRITCVSIFGAAQASPLKVSVDLSFQHSRAKAIPHAPCAPPRSLCKPRRVNHRVVRLVRGSFARDDDPKSKLMVSKPPPGQLPLPTLPTHQHSRTHKNTHARTRAHTHTPMSRVGFSVAPVTTDRQRRFARLKRMTHSRPLLSRQVHKI